MRYPVLLLTLFLSSTSICSAASPGTSFYFDKWSEVPDGTAIVRLVTEHFTPIHPTQGNAERPVDSYSLQIVVKAYQTKDTVYTYRVDRILERMVPLQTEHIDFKYPVELIEVTKADDEGIAVAAAVAKRAAGQTEVVISENYKFVVDDRAPLGITRTVARGLSKFTEGEFNVEREQVLLFSVTPNAKGARVFKRFGADEQTDRILQNTPMVMVDAALADFAALTSIEREKVAVHKGFDVEMQETGEPSWTVTGIFQPFNFVVDGEQKQVSAKEIGFREPVITGFIQGGSKLGKVAQANGIYHTGQVELLPSMYRLYEISKTDEGLFAWDWTDWKEGIAFRSFNCSVGNPVGIETIYLRESKLKEPLGNSIQYIRCEKPLVLGRINAKEKPAPPPPPSIPPEEDPAKRRAAAVTLRTERPYRRDGMEEPPTAELFPQPLAGDEAQKLLAQVDEIEQLRKAAEAAGIQYATKLIYLNNPENWQQIWMMSEGNNPHCLQVKIVLRNFEVDLGNEYKRLWLWGEDFKRSVVLGKPPEPKQELKVSVPNVSQLVRNGTATTRTRDQLNDLKKWLVEAKQTYDGQTARINKIATELEAAGHKSKILTNLKKAGSK